MNKHLSNKQNHEAADIVSIDIPNVKVNPYSRRAIESQCACGICGRPLGWSPTHVAISIGNNADGQRQFLPVEKYGDLNADPVEYGTFIGSVCAKRLPKEYRITMKKASKNSHNWA